MKLKNVQFKLIKPFTFKRIETYISSSKDKILVKPTLVSICKSDLRYYSGNRPAEVLKRKLPLVLVHEGIGVVQEDKNGFKKGDYVIIIPLISKNDSNNYNPKNYFLSSNADGLLQGYIALPPKNIIKLPDYLSKQEAVLSELISVAYHAQTRIKIKESDKIAIMGDGSLGKILYFVLKEVHKKNSVNLFGKNSRITENYDIAFECVGKENARLAIDNAIKALNYNGTLVLLGVSEMEIPIKTRLIVDKGLTIIGSNRSNHNDFNAALRLFKNSAFRKHINSISDDKLYEVNNLTDLKNCFDSMLKNNLKKKLILFLGNH